MQDESNQIPQTDNDIAQVIFEQIEQHGVEKLEQSLSRLLNLYAKLDMEGAVNEIQKENVRPALLFIHEMQESIQANYNLIPDHGN